MILLRSSCPRCGGDLSLVHDLGDSYYSCVQCGYISYGKPGAAPASAARLTSVVPKREGREAPRRRKPAEAA